MTSDWWQWYFTRTNDSIEIRTEQNDLLLDSKSIVDFAMMTPDASISWANQCYFKKILINLSDEIACKTSKDVNGNITISVSVAPKQAAQFIKMDFEVDTPLEDDTIDEE